MPKRKTPAKRKKNTRGINKKPAFLKAYAVCASVEVAAEAVGIHRTLHYAWLKDPEYKAAFEATQTHAGQQLEDDAVHWARIGVFEPLVYKGRFQFAEREKVLCRLPDGREVPESELPDDLEGVEIVGRRTVVEKYGPPLGVHRRSESLMGRVLKAFMPVRYGDRVANEISGPGGAPIDTALTVTFVKPA